MARQSEFSRPTSQIVPCPTALVEIARSAAACDHLGHYPAVTEATVDPIKLFTVIALVSLPTVMFGGYSLLRLSTVKKLTPFQETYFRAGHAHAGVLLVLSLVSLVLLGGTDFGNGVRWLVCLLLLLGVLAQSGGMFLHAFTGTAGVWSRGNTLTVGGGILLAVAMLLLAVGVATT